MLIVLAIGSPDLLHTSRKRLIDKPSSRGAWSEGCGTAKHMWHTGWCCATGKHLAVAHVLVRCATAKLDPGRPAYAHLGVARLKYVRHG